MSDTRGKESGEPAPLVSVVTIVKNGESTLERAIKSVLGQTYSNVEYLIIDGASTDGTLDIIRAYEDRLAAWVSEPDSGISDAFNKGVRRASGEWVGILNADDWYEPGALTRVMSVANEADVIHGAMQYWSDGQPTEVFFPNQRRLRLEMTINHPTCFVRRSLYEQFGLFRTDFKFAMDYELMLRFLMDAARFTQLDDVLTNMSYGGVSDTAWLGAAREVRLAQIENGLGPLRSWVLYAWRLVRGRLRRRMQALGLDGAVRQYRKTFSLVRKQGQ